MADVPLIGPLTAGRIKAEMGRKGEQRLESLVSRVVLAAAEQCFGRCMFENVYLAGFSHGAAAMERKLTCSPSASAPTVSSRERSGE